MSFAKPLLPQGAELPAPVSRFKVNASLLAALAVTLLPWADGVRWLIPDFTLIVILYWCIHAPRLCGLGGAFTLGLLTDVATGVLLGLNALAYCAAAFVVLLLQRRLQGFPPPQQALQLMPILFAKEALVLTIGLAVSRGDTDWRYLAGGLLTALLWLPVSLLLNRLCGRPDQPVQAQT